jgi:hypothetical protein
MLRIKIEIVPYGVEEGVTVLHTFYVGNDGKGNRSIGHYDVYDQDPRDAPYPRSSRPGWVGRLLWVPRRGSDRNRLRLAERALHLAVAKTKANQGVRD